MFLARDARYGIRRWVEPSLEGGGYSFCAALIDEVAAGPRPARVLDWCAGTGTVGFDLLGLGLTDEVTLTDINEQALEVAARTIQSNGLDRQVRLCQSARPADIRDLGPWELIVGNPPHVNGADDKDPYQRAHPPVLWQDNGWQTHRLFFTDVADCLTPGGRFVLIENHRFAAPEMLCGLTAECGFPGTRIRQCETPWLDYFLLIGNI